MASVLAFIFWSFQISLIFSGEVLGFSWGSGKRVDRLSRYTGLPSSTSPSASVSEFDPSKLPSMYAAALSELQELESEPLCHRIAARLLVNNCQLLDGRDDATILTDSGRAARDFVDSYAASLAICDLERGSFAIPSSCSKFQESTLARIPPPTKPQLHVTTGEIDSCLEGLAQSDSAWNTWVSYRHKTLRFCEAARADNEKGMLDEKRGIAPDTKRCWQQSADYITHGLGDARHLQTLIAMLVDMIQNQSRDLTTSHEFALQETTQRIATEVDVIWVALTAAVASSTNLQRDLEISHSAAAAVALRQEKIELSMKKLEGLADSLLVQHEGHQERLVHAQQTASDLIDILDAASSSAVTLRSSIYSNFGWGSWWPYVFCPLTSLVVGSYGLPPSATRNFMLISLGEMAGFGVSIAKYYGNDIYTAFSSHGARANSTIAFDKAIYPKSSFIHDDFQQI
ncbi:nuclear membrane fusion kar5 [Trichoderma arundinaceum]|uniref:Nuclear membrane fusion kar5 n=1 Tax=Trichoderma arundinaceum TaxID=490622 RepID=A0A395P015_TRIAR|nr:nuclear membrane fusion kar5 [Trichoderma arundinaceum]